MRIIRVFPKRTALTPIDDYAFVGDPPMLRPEADEVHVSCSFTWDLPRAERLALAWGQFYPVVKIGGLSCHDDEFVPGRYVRGGVTFTSRGCNNQCPWCQVLEREGRLREIEVKVGNRIEDNNLLQCSRQHIGQVFDMLRTQHLIHFNGGLDSRLLTDAIAEDMRSLRIRQVFFAADTKESLRPLEKAIKRLGLSRQKTRCYVLLSFNGETISEATERLQAVWEIGAMPFAQLYQPPDRHIKYSKDWRNLARTWSRPAAMKSYVNAREGH